MMFKLLCYVHGDDYQQAFEVKIGEEETIAALKKAIKEEKSPDFDHIPADSIVVWNALILFNRDLKEKVEALNLVDDDSLQPPEILSDLFPSRLEKMTVHIIVDRPPPGELYLPVVLMYPYDLCSYTPVLFPQTDLLRER